MPSAARSRTTGAGQRGYHDAGFDVVSVDVEPRLRYPYEFHQGDALEFLAEHGHEFDVWHGSPPCRDWTTLANLVGFTGTAHLLPTPAARSPRTRPSGCG